MQITVFAALSVSSKSFADIKLNMYIHGAKIIAYISRTVLRSESHESHLINQLCSYKCLHFYFEVRYNNTVAYNLITSLLGSSFL